VPAEVNVDRDSEVPLYQQLAAQLRHAIETGALQPGERIENELQLAARLKLSRPTVARAINQLVRVGLLVRRRGFGTEVSSTVEHQRTELTSLFEDLLRNRRQPSTQVLFLGQGIVNPSAAELLRLPSAAPLVHVRRLRFAARSPVAVMENWLPAEFSWLTEADLVAEGLYSVLRTRGRGPDSARQRIGAKAAGSADAALLKVRRGTPLLTMDSLAFDVDGIPVECGTHVYRADVYSIEVLVHADPSSNAGS
jgi:DNA-binding GntR family transcriptional regulator